MRTLGGTTRYRLIYRNKKQVLEHRAVMADHLGRELLPHEVVHHRDGDGLNNSIENLELTTQLAHRRAHGGPRLWDLAEALKMREEGATIRAVAQHFGVSDAAVHTGLRRRGHPTTTPRLKKFSREQAFDMYRAGYVIAEIARHLGVAPPSVRRALLLAGLHKSQLTSA